MGRQRRRREGSCARPEASGTMSCLESYAARKKKEVFKQSNTVIKPTKVANELYTIDVSGDCRKLLSHPRSHGTLGWLPVSLNTHGLEMNLGQVLKGVELGLGPGMGVEGGGARGLEINKG